MSLLRRKAPEDNSITLFKADSSEEEPSVKNDSLKAAESSFLESENSPYSDSLVDSHKTSAREVEPDSQPEEKEEEPSTPKKKRAPKRRKRLTMKKKKKIKGKALSLHPPNTSPENVIVSENHVDSWKEDDFKSFYGFSVKELKDLKNRTERYAKLCGDVELNFISQTAEILSRFPEPIKAPLSISFDSDDEEEPRVERGRPKKTENILIDEICIPEDEDMYKCYYLGARKLWKSNFEPLALIGKEELKEMDERYNYSDYDFDDDILSKEKLQMLQEPLASKHKWWRLVKMNHGDDPGNVIYFSPNGFYLKTLEGIQKSLESTPETSLTLDNFSFAVSPVGALKECVWREGIKMKKGPKFNPFALQDYVIKGKRSYITELRNKAKAKREHLKDQILNEASAAGFKVPDMKKNKIISRGPRKRKDESETKHVSLIDNIKKNDEEGGLFGISAIAECLSRMNNEQASRELMDYNAMLEKAEKEEEFESILSMIRANNMMNSDEDELDDGEVPAKGKIHPCSIRCPGCPEVPELNCSICLCMYHAQCIGYPAGTYFKDFICSYCSNSDGAVNEEILVNDEIAVEGNENEDEDGEFDEDEMNNSQLSFSSLTYTKGSKIPIPILSNKSFVSSNRVSPNFNKSFGNLKFGDKPPKSLQLPFKIMDSNVNLNKGNFRKILPKIPPIPELKSHNLTITPMPSSGKGKLPQIPNLAPIRFPLKRKSEFISSSPLTNPLKKDKFGRLLCHTGGLKKSEKKLPIPDFGSWFNDNGRKKIKLDADEPLFHPFPQSVIEIAGKRYIVIPDGSKDVVNSKEKENIAKHSDMYKEGKALVDENDARISQAEVSFVDSLCSDEVSQSIDAEPDEKELNEYDHDSSTIGSSINDDESIMHESFGDKSFVDNV